MGKIKENFFKRGIEHYLLRLQPYARVEIAELPENRADEKKASRSEIIEEEALGIEKYCRDGAHRIALSAEGKKMSSEELAFYFERLLIEGKSKVDFIIGGPSGLAETVKKKGNLCLSLSDFTFPHRLVRLILLEQIYRCFKIIRGEPYHK